MAQTESPRGAAISLRVCRNGDPFDKGHRVIYNDKQTRNFESFLNDLTSRLRPRFGAVRKLFTPEHGHSVDDLTSIKSGRTYVAAGPERFKKLPYMTTAGPNAGRAPRHRPHPPPKRNEEYLINFRFKSTVVASARHRKVSSETFRIFVFTNGNELLAAQQFLFTRRQLDIGLDHVLDLVSSKIVLNTGAVKKLYRMDGGQVTDVYELCKGEYYVAGGGEKFKKVQYGIMQGVWNTSPRSEHRGASGFNLPPIGQSSKQERRGFNSRNVIRSRNPSDRGSSDHSDQRSEKSNRSNQSVPSLPSNRNGKGSRAPRPRPNAIHDRQKTKDQRSVDDKKSPSDDRQREKEKPRYEAEDKETKDTRNHHNKDETSRSKKQENEKETRKEIEESRRGGVADDNDNGDDNHGDDKDGKKEELSFYAQPKEKIESRSDPDDFLLHNGPSNDSNGVFYSKNAEEEKKEEEEEEVEETEETKVEIPVDLREDEEVEEEEVEEEKREEVEEEKREEVEEEKREEEDAREAAENDEDAGGRRNSADLNSAATKIQANFRGYSTRKTLEEERRARDSNPGPDEVQTQDGDSHDAKEESDSNPRRVDDDDAQV